MSKVFNKKLFIYTLIVVVAICAIAVGITFFVLSSRKIRDIPQNLTVERVDDDFYLSVTNNNLYGVKFNLEILNGDEYVLIDEIKSDSNFISLSKNNVKVGAGERYRFSANFFKDNSVGPKSQEFEWQSSFTLKTIDYQSTEFVSSGNEQGVQTKIFESTTSDGKTFQNSIVLAWDGLNYADNYTVMIFDKDGTKTQRFVSDAKLSLDFLNVGRYKIYIVGTSQNEYLLPSPAGDGIYVEISGKNQILSAILSNKVLTISSTLKVNAFEIVDGENIVAQITPSNFSFSQGKYVFVVDASFLKGENLKIRSLEQEWIDSSEFVDIAFE